MDVAHRVRVFISYAHVDEALRQRLRAYLKPLEREGFVQAWDDREILGGAAWADEIDARLNQADVILLLVTADFINSEYCHGKEMARALERSADPDDRAIVIPIILRTCDWESSEFAGRLQALPPDAQPISKWPTEEDYYTAVAKGLRRRIEQLINPDTRWIDRAGRGLRDPRRWQRPRVWATATGSLLLVAAAVGWWWRAAAEADGEVAVALQHMRSGRYLEAMQRVEPACQRLIARHACFTLDKARLGVQLEKPDALPLEQFAAQVEALKAKAPDDPDLMLFSAELTLRENRDDQHAQALADIARAIVLAGGKFPEAYFYLANLELMAGRHAKALPLLDQALDPKTNKVAPDHYLNARAYARAHTDDIAGAVQDYEQSAERGSILSRIELAELLWRRSEFDRASDQLRAASRALGAANAPLSGRNALPWAFETAQEKPVLLNQAFEKRCHARWMLQAGLALAGRAQPDDAPTWDDCGPDATAIASAVVASLARAVKGGMNETGQQRAREFANRHKLFALDTGGG